MLHLLSLVQTATATSGSPDSLGLLSVGAFVAMINAAVTFGIVKGKTDGMESFKDEVRDSFSKVNERIDGIVDKLGGIQRDLGRVEGDRPKKELRQ
jgi:hypothetical protein